MKITLAIILTLVQLRSGPIWAKESPIYVIRPTNVPVSEFDTSLSRSAHEQPISKYFIENIIDQKISNAILKQFEAAQSLYFQGDLQKSYQAYSQIIELGRRTHLAAAAQKVVHFCYLRLSELSLDPQQKERHLQQALAFQASLDINVDVFAPPMQTQFRQLKSQFSYRVYPYLHWKDFSAVVINGKVHVVRPDLEIQLAPGESLVTWISDSALPESRWIDNNLLAQTSPPTRLLAHGDCQLNSTHIKSLKTSAVKLYTPTQCQQQLPDKVVSTNKEQNRNTAKGVILATESSPEHAVQVSLSPQQSKPLWKNKWFWIGTGVVAAVIWSMARNQKNSDGPEERSQQKEEDNEPPVITGF